MPNSNRLALLRYQVLDASFAWSDSDLSSGAVTPKKLFKTDLLSRVNEFLKEAVPGIKPIAMRTLEKDIADMQAIYGVEIVKHSDQKRAYYAYAESGMGIGNVGLSSQEQAMLHGVLSTLARFRGMEGFGWWIEMEALLRHRFELILPQSRRSLGRRLALQKSNRLAPRVQENQALRWLDDAVNSLQLQLPARVGFAASNAEQSERHSMLVESLVEQHSGWMVLALVWDDEAQEAFRLILPLGSIVSWDDVLVDVPEGLKEALPFDWLKYVDQRFQLSPGIVVDAQEAPVTIRLWFDMKTAKEYTTQPFHPSQDPRIERSGNGIVMQANLVPNRPLMQWILHHGSSAQILEPAKLREELGEEARSVAASYAKMFGP